MLTHSGAFLLLVLTASNIVTVLIVFRYRKALLTYKEQAVRDQLTGLYNRRQFESDQEQLNGAGDRTLMLFDIDHFKKVNDTYGHQIGDQVLQAIAQQLDGAVRAQDKAYRIGGEEFAVLMPVSEEDIHEVVFRLHDMLCRSYRVIDGNVEFLLPVTISAGAVVARGDQKDWKRIFGTADGLLYAVKNSGRNSFRMVDYIPGMDQEER